MCVCGIFHILSISLGYFYHFTGPKKNSQINFESYLSLWLWRTLQMFSTSPVEKMWMRDISYKCALLHVCDEEKTAHRSLLSARTTDNLIQIHSFYPFIVFNLINSRSSLKKLFAISLHPFHSILDKYFYSLLHWTNHFLIQFLPHESLRAWKINWRAVFFSKLFFFNTCWNHRLVVQFIDIMEIQVCIRYSISKIKRIVNCFCSIFRIHIAN